MADQPVKKPGLLLLMEAAEALSALPELGSGELLGSRQRPDLNFDLRIQCHVRTHEIIPPDQLPNVIETIVAATIRTDISMDPTVGIFLASHTDMGAITGCLADMGVTDWEVGYDPSPATILLKQSEETARERLTRELTAMFRAEDSSIGEGIMMKAAQGFAGQMIREGRVPKEVLVTMLVGSPLGNIASALRSSAHGHPRSTHPLDPSGGEPVVH